MRKILAVLLLLLMLLNVNLNVSAFAGFSEGNSESQFQELKKAELPNLPSEH